MVIDAGRISGEGGCNTYSAQVTTEPRGSVRIGPVVATKRACAQDDRMRDETAFLQSLGRVRSLEVDHDGHLVLADDAGAPIHVFERQRVRP